MRRAEKQRAGFMMSLGVCRIDAGGAGAIPPIKQGGPRCLWLYRRGAGTGLSRAGLMALTDGQRKIIGWGVLLALLAVGVWLRVSHATSNPLWEDEAESSINAQTILLEGVPTDHFLGEPIYENIMVRPWPESEEYEFKDLSYSDKGVAVYHGWLPLYSIAGSMAVFGEQPDQRSASLLPQHPVETIKRRTVVPRVPAIMFSVVFMALMFGLGRTLGGPGAGWAALVYAAIAKKNVYYGAQARYYSLTLLLITGCGWALWRIAQRGWWRDYLLGAFGLVLLFHTHITSCLGMCVIGGLTLPWHKAHALAWRKRGVVFLILLIGTLPWLWWTGFIDHTRGIPAAWRMDGFWEVVYRYQTQRPVELSLFIFGVTATVLASLLGKRMPQRLVEAFGERKHVYLYLSLWAGVMFVTFAGCIPAASFFATRLSLMIAVPCMLLAAVIVSGMCMLVSRRWSHVLAPLAVVGMLAVTGRLFTSAPPASQADPFEGPRTLIEYLAAAELSEDTRLYGTPNTHLVKTYYTGLPIQSIGPIRKLYIDAYPGPIVLFRKMKYQPPPSVEEVMTAAGRAGVELSDAAARDWVERIYSRVQREEVVGEVDSVWPILKPVPAYLSPLIDRQRAETEAYRDRLSWNFSSALMFKGFKIRTSLNWWQTFQYRFVDVASRSGKNANYADRVRSAVAEALPRGRCMVYRCPPLREAK